MFYVVFILMSPSVTLKISAQRHDMYVSVKRCTLVHACSRKKQSS
jgi:hypothetical protein